MTDSTNTSWNADELSWLAFRYVNNELAAEELAAFEHRLAADLTAQEEVAKAVELTLSVAALSPASGPIQTSRSTLPALRTSAGWSSKMTTWWSAIALGVGLIGVFWRILPTGSPDAVEVAWANDSEALSAVADHWAEIRQSARQASEAGDEVQSNELVIPTSEPILAEEEEVGLPHWLVSAVAADDPWNPDQE
ncbi:MAG: hypothetical protein U1D30_24740 [Planctomycetota bacterium]